MRLYCLFLFSFFFFGCEAFRQVPPAGRYPVTEGGGQPVTDPSLYQGAYDSSQGIYSGTNFNNGGQGPPGGTGQGPPIGTGQDFFSGSGQSSLGSSQSGNTEWGVIVCDPSQVEVFNTELRKFLSTTFPLNRIPPVQCTGELKGGLLIRGKVYFEGAKFDLNSPSHQLNVSSDSYLEIHVIGTDGSRSIPAFKMKAIPLTSYARGNYVFLAFQDKKGKIYMEGSINERGRLIGPFRYENLVPAPGRTAIYRGQMGFHSIYACQLLDCA